MPYLLKLLITVEGIASAFKGTPETLIKKAYVLPWHKIIIWESTSLFLASFCPSEKLILCSFPDWMNKGGSRTMPGRLVWNRWKNKTTALYLQGVKTTAWLSLRYVLACQTGEKTLGLVNQDLRTVFFILICKSYTYNRCVK